MHKLLVVDDDPGNRSLSADILLQAWPDCEVLTAPDGRIGWRVAQMELPDLILLDWEMPVMNGLELLKQVRSTQSTKEIPIIMYTGIQTSPDRLEEALKAGANEFLRKPLEAVELIARIRSIQLQQKYLQEKLLAQQAQAQLLLEIHVREIQLKKEDLASLTIILEQKDHFLRKVLRRLESHQDSSDLETQNQELKILTRGINRELNSEKNWEAMKKRINEMDTQFLALLVEKHPDLTTNELKLCSLLKLNLSGKETADILHISPAGVEKRRYRLRKKLGIGGEVRLENYIHSFSKII